jgi:hypothetical protein
MASKAILKSSGREAALARRKALSNKGKSAAASASPERTRAGSHRRPASELAAASTREAASSAPASSSIRTPEPPVTERGSTGLAQPRSQTARRRATPTSPAQQARAQVLERRHALSRAGRRAVKSQDRVRVAESKPAAAPASPEDCGCGCKEKDRQRAAEPAAPMLSLSSHNGNGSRRNGNGKLEARSRRVNQTAAKPASRALVLARRAAQSTRGKAASNTPSSAASLARQANPKLSGRELAQRVRAQRSTSGGAGERKSAPTGRMRMRASDAQGAGDQHWKVGVSETAGGQSVTGTRVGRSRKTTGDEASTCRAVTGTEYMGAEIFRAFCQSDPAPTRPAKVGVSVTGHGNRVSGNEVGRSAKVTGDEPGTCQNVTGTAYLSPSQYEAYCGTRPTAGPRKVGQGTTSTGKPVSGTLVGRSAKVTGDEHGADVRPTGTQYTDVQSIQNGRVDTAGSPAAKPVPPKVGVSMTLAGGTVTGTRLGRSGNVTGDEPGACRDVTGDEYVDQQQFQSFCNTKPSPEPAKVGLSATLKGQKVSGTQTGRSGKVTGDEPGTCKAITGTPYAGLEQAATWCEPDDQKQIRARTRPLAGTAGPNLTGQQPGVGGVMTGAARGACEPLTGTPYVGKDQFAEVCGAANPGDVDFPQLLDADGQSVGRGFTVRSPARAAFQAAVERRQVTGTQYESGGPITGPFGMATGKITGTEQFRFDAKRPRQDLLTMEQSGEDSDGEAEAAPAQPVVSRITGEGQAAGSKITGDDWDRGDRVTGTEGLSARRRNPTRPGPMSAMPAVERKRNVEVAEPVSRVTGSSGGTDRGALVTYSGGARG